MLCGPSNLSDFCIGKPLQWLPLTSTVADATAELKAAGVAATVTVRDGGEASDVLGRFAWPTCCSSYAPKPTWRPRLLRSKPRSPTFSQPPPVHHIEPDARLHVYLSLDRHERRDAFS